MSRMNDQYQQEEERENLSGMDLCEAWHEEMKIEKAEWDKLNNLIYGNDFVQIFNGDRNE